MPYAPSRERQSWVSADLRRPPLKWAGGKRKLVPLLTQTIERIAERTGRYPTRLIEPFAGGAALSFLGPISTVVLGDTNRWVLNFYRELALGLKVFEPLTNDQAYYYEVRDKFNEHILKPAVSLDEETRRCMAVWLYYMNKTGFNGLYRVNRKGMYNVPYGHRTHVAYVRDWSPYTARMEDWYVQRAGDFENTVVAPTDIVYCDPPYDRSFTAYAMAGFDWTAQLRLARWIAKQPCPVIVSNYASKRIVELYTSLGFHVDRIYEARAISCNGDRNAEQCVLAVHMPS